LEGLSLINEATTSKKGTQIQGAIGMLCQECVEQAFVARMSKANRDVSHPQYPPRTV
jgi:hypothetical protein